MFSKSVKYQPKGSQATVHWERHQREKQAATVQDHGNTCSPSPSMTTLPPSGKLANPRRQRIDVLHLFGIVQQLRRHQALPHQVLVQLLLFPCFPIFPPIDAIHEASLFRIVEVADERTRVVGGGLSRSLRRIQRLLALLNKSLLEFRRRFPRHCRGFLFDVAGSDGNDLVLGLLQGILQFLPDLLGTVVRQALLAGFAALLPILQLLVHRGLVRKQDSRMMAADIRRLPDFAGISIEPECIRISRLAEGFVGLILEFHCLLALLEHQMDVLGHLVELLADALVVSPGRHGDLAPEGLQRSHARASGGAFRHALGLRGVHAVVQHHRDYCSGLLAHRRHPQLCVVRACDPRARDVQSRGAVVVCPQHIGIPIQQLQAHRRIAGGERGIQRRSLHARFSGFDVGAVVQQKLDNIQRAMPASAVYARPLRHLINSFRIGAVLQQGPQHVRAGRHLRGPVADGGQDQGIGHHARTHLQKLRRAILVVLPSLQLGQQGLRRLLRRDHSLDWKGPEARRREGR
mmetsp:Transcript_41166/g.130405  ORF Transcript_41166/g.130405 Transcript_41166/m.130405 type:complete len:518 (-) Transcript_41166:30-1583(-)